MAQISFVHVGKTYADGTVALDDLNLDIRDGEFMVLVGPSGCGKTTALQMAAGLETVTTGTICIGDRVVNDVPSKDRDIAMVFQTYALYPHMTVFDNMAFGLRLRKRPRAEVDRRIRESAEVLEITALLDKKPRQLSGGQRQRVAMGRAIVREPQAFLMDEPLSNLDAQLRVHMRTEIARIQQGLNVTAIYVTHDQVEAMTMGDRVAVMSDGKLQQVGTPREVYETPANQFVAGFIGSPRMNFLAGVLKDASQGEGLEFCAGSTLISLGRSALQHLPTARAYAGQEVILGVRPEDVHDPAHQPHRPGFESLDVDVRLREELGSHVLLHFALPSGDAPLSQQVHKGIGAITGSQVRSALLVAQVPSQSAHQGGARSKLAIDTTRIHLFDPVTDASLPRAIEPEPAAELQSLSGAGTGAAILSQDE